MMCDKGIDKYKGLRSRNCDSLALLAYTTHKHMRWQLGSEMHLEDGSCRCETLQPPCLRVHGIGLPPNASVTAKTCSDQFKNSEYDCKQSLPALLRCVVLVAAAVAVDTQEASAAFS